MGFQQTGIVLGGAIALGPADPAGHHHHHPRGRPRGAREIRDGSLALGATVWQTTWRQTLPSAIPASPPARSSVCPVRSVRPRRWSSSGSPARSASTPTGVLSPITALPMQIYSLTSQSQEEFREAAAAAIIVLLVMILGLNGLAIFIRNKFQRTW